jgi:hypothetical protein
MIWEDVLLSRKFGDDAIAAGLSKAFSVPPANVLVVAEITGEAIPQDIAVLCHSIDRRGKFPLQLSIYLKDKRLEKFDKAIAVGILCRWLKCVALIDDANGNPYSRFLIDETGGARQIFLDAQKFDDFDEIVVSQAGDS